MKILFVCLGNICRSPMARGILQKQVDDLGLDWQIDSAGLAHKYVGCAVDPRVMKIAKKHGIELANHYARRFETSDFDKYDMIITMDDELGKRIRAKADNLSQREKIWLLPDFLEGIAERIDLPDPYLWETPIFESLFFKIESACQVIIATFNTPNILDLFDDTITKNALDLEGRI
jgi:protein-tyrosine phosphatase